MTSRSDKGDQLDHHGIRGVGTSKLAAQTFKMHQNLNNHSSTQVIDENSSIVMGNNGNNISMPGANFKI